MSGKFCDIRKPYIMLPKARRLIGLINCGLFSFMLSAGMCRGLVISEK